MNSNFIEEMKEIINGDSECGYYKEPFMIKTGITCFDYLNGKISMENGKKVSHIGIDAGKIVTVIGKTGSGKSTFAAQIGGNIVKRYDNGLLYYFDFENGMTIDRIANVSGMSEEECASKVQINNLGISSDAVLKIVYQLKKFKLDHANELMVENKEGIYEDDGTLTKILPPTVIIIDSLAAMMPKDELGVEEIKGGMSASANAKANNQLFSRLVQPIAEANIIVIVINHIKQAISMGTPVAASINYLKQGETLNGGTGAQYMSNTLIKITASTKLEEDKTYGIKGYESKLELIKSRTAAAGKSMTLVYDQVEGFDNDLSLFNYIKLNGMVKGNGMAYKFVGLDDGNHNFKMSNFKEKLASDKLLHDRLYELGEELLCDSIKTSNRMKIATNAPIEIDEPDDEVEVSEEDADIEEVEIEEDAE